MKPAPVVGFSRLKEIILKNNIQKVCRLIQNVCILADRTTGKI